MRNNLLVLGVAAIVGSQAFLASPSAANTGMLAASASTATSVAVTTQTRKTEDHSSPSANPGSTQHKASSSVAGGPDPAFYAGELTLDSLTFNNPNGQVAGNQHYCVQEFTVDADGVYVVEMASPNTSGSPSDALDTFLRLYANAFDPTAPAGAIAFNDDFTGTLTVLPGPFAGIITATATGFQNAQPSSRLAGVALTAGTQYFLVHTAWPSSGNTQGGTAGQPVGAFYAGIGGPGAITLGASDCAGVTDPEIEVSPGSFEFTVEAGDTDSDALTIGNIGGGTLTWNIETEDATGALRGGGFDPLLDEPLDVPNFTVISPANGGTPQVFTIPAGVLTSGIVVGFSFEGTVSGITGNGDWASDMCMQIEGPDGSMFSVGGIGAAIPNCNVNLWDFNGGGSTNDGTYASEHLDIWPFPPGAADDGDWTFTFIHGWNSTSANPMNWSGVTVTLHKVGIPEPCDNPGLVSWLSVDPGSGTTEPGSPSLVDVLIDTDGLAPGVYSANLCVHSDDTAGNELVVVPVELTVIFTGEPEITVDPGSLSGTADEGAFTTATLTIGNIGDAELFWEIEEAPAAHPRAHFPRVPYQVRSSGRSGSLHAEPVDPDWLEKMEERLGGPGSQHSRSAVRGVVGTVPAYTTTGFSRSDYVTLDALVPGALTTIIDPSPGTIFAQTFIDDDFSQHFFVATGGGALPQNAYGYLDTSTGAVNQLGVLTGVPASGTWVSAAWDPTTGTVYAVIVPAGGDNRLFSIDVGTGIGTLVGSVSGMTAGSILIAIAINNAGSMFGLEIFDDVLVAIDKTDATGAVIGPVGVNANFAQDMDFDRSTGTLYWASYLGGGNSNIRTIDTSTGAATVVGPIQDGAELLSFSIAVAGGGSCENPADIPWLSVDIDNGTIASGGPDDVVEVTMDAAALSEGVYNARLCVLSNDPGNPVVDIPVEFTVTAAGADLAVSVFGVPGIVSPSGAVSFAVTVENFGPDQAEDVSVQVDLPAEFGYVSGGLIDGSGDWDCSAAGQTVTCDLTGTLAVDAEEVLQIDVDVDADAKSGTVDTLVVVTSSTVDPNPANNIASTSTTIAAPLIFANGFECAEGVPGCGDGTPGFYTDRDEFLANVQAGFYEEPFNDVPVGPAGPMLSFSGNGFSYDVTAVGAGSNNLYNDPGIVSTDSALDALRITFTGAPVTAVGGNFWASDIGFNPTGGEIILELEDGTIESYSPSSMTSFGGFVTVSPIVHITIEAPDVPANNWTTMDNVIVGKLD
ncbi:MAG TPA: DUF11 domain-containing protein [Xanthomonadaceae bacterium]|nr:DUF11 domain-containing protein [Xanthomonadaceae bacterium]